ncbi:ATP-dependent protease La Type I, partial [hydrothermal vent metagenome]
MTDTAEILPVLPLRDIVVFPHMIVPLFAGREKSVKALEQVMGKDKRIFLLTQLDPGTDDPAAEDLHHFGCIAKVLQLLKLPDGTLKVLVEGEGRGRATGFEMVDGYIQVSVEAIAVTGDNTDETTAMMRSAVDGFERYVKLNKKIPPDIVTAVRDLDNAAKLADSIAAHLSIKLKEKQQLLEIVDVTERLEAVLGKMEGEISVLQVERKIRSRVKRQMEKSQREYYLNEQMKAIQRELGDAAEAPTEADELVEKVAKTKLSKEARTKADAELKKLKQMNPMSAESTVVRNYLDWLVGIPWGKKTRARIDLVKAKAILDEDHY